MIAMQEQSRTTVIEVEVGQGHYPVYGLRDCNRIVEGYKFVSGKPLYMHALQALDPQHYTGRGTVTFHIASSEEEA